MFWSAGGSLPRAEDEGIKKAVLLQNFTIFVLQNPVFGSRTGSETALIKNAGSAWNLHPSVADPEYLSPIGIFPSRIEGRVKKIAGSETLLSSNYIFYQRCSSTIFDHRAFVKGTR
jgi:hypothetical protein